MSYATRTTECNTHLDDTNEPEALFTCRRPSPREAASRAVARVFGRSMDGGVVMTGEDRLVSRSSTVRPPICNDNDADYPPQRQNLEKLWKSGNGWAGDMKTYFRPIIDMTMLLLAVHKIKVHEIRSPLSGATNFEQKQTKRSCQISTRTFQAGLFVSRRLS